jgi:hypothetical protein
VQALLLVGDPPALEIELDKHVDLRAEDLRLEGLGHVVDGADGVSLEDILLVFADRREKDDRHEPRSFARLDHLRSLEAVHAGHLHIEQDDGELALEQATQRGLAGLRAHDALSERLENRLEGE